MATPTITTTTTTTTTTTGTPTSQTWFQQACADVALDKDTALLIKNRYGGLPITTTATVLPYTAQAALLWDTGKQIKIGFLGGTGPQQSKVQIVITEWQKYANVHFVIVEGTSDSATADIRVTFDPLSASWSYIGVENTKVATGQATMNLAGVGTDSSISSDERGIILHEFGHALGLIHEHQAAAQGGPALLDADAVSAVESYVQRTWTADDVNNQVLDIYNLVDVSNYVTLDTSSIMKFFIPDAMDTEKLTVSPNHELSNFDKAYMFLYYPLPGPSPDDPVWTIDHALACVGVTGSMQTAISTAYSNSDWNGVRTNFTLFLNGGIPPPAQGVDSGPTETFEPNWCGTDDMSASSAPTSVSQGLSAPNALLWVPGSTITWCFLLPTLPPGEVNPNPANTLSPANAYRKNRVRQVFADYQARVNLTFSERPDDAAGQSVFRISFGRISQTFSWSKLGKNSIGTYNTAAELTTHGGRAHTTIFYHDWHVGQSPPTTTFFQNIESEVLYHEIGHALGLDHEQMSPTASNFLWKPEQGAYLVYTPFDSKSVMLYPWLLYGTTLWQLVKNLLTFNLTTCNHLPSIMDYAFLGLLYPKSAANEVAGTAFLDNLATLGIPAGSAEAAALVAQRNTAFAQGNIADTEREIGTLRQLLQTTLAAYTATHPRYDYSLNPPAAHDTDPPPAQDAGNPGSSGTPDPNITTGSFLDVLLGTLTDLFSPTTGQTFALQFPGRFLDQSQYAWDTSSAGIYGQFVKPTVVNESEFRLVDQLYNVGTVVGAPNGINLSIVYQQCLNNLLPGFQSATSIVAQQQDQIRQWLLKEVPVSGWVSDLITAQHAGAASSSPVATSTTGAPTGAASGVTGSSSGAQGPQFSVSNKLDGNSVNRMELARALMQEYLSAKQAWELERDNMIQNATPSTLADVTRNLSHITAIRESQLASKYADAVVRGYSHVIRQYMGYMDIKSPAESLQDAKDALRESGSSSLDGSLTVYPVQMQPIDWFQSLSTSFTLEDLTSDPALIDQQIDAKSKQLDVLNSRLAALQLNPKIDMTALQAQLDAAQQQYDNAQATLSNTYSNEIISLAKSCVSSVGDFLFPAFEALAVTYNIAETTYSGIDTSMGNITAAQKAVTQASRAYSQLLAQKALASATDTQNEQTQITLNINSLTKDLDELTARRQALRTPQATDATGAPIPTPPSSSTSINDVVLLPPNTQAGGSRWQDIVMHHNLTTQFSSQSSASSGSTSQTNIGLFLFNQSSSSSSSGATSSNQSGETSYDVQVGFRATLVTVDRSGWFQPQFFKQSNGFYHIDDTVSWSKWPAGITTLDDLKKAGATAYDAINKYMLPAYPVGFIICKDITIKIAMTATQVSSDAANFQQTLAKSQGILCFSTSSAETSTSSQNSYNFTSASDGIIIRIPGPQILGYYLQLTDNDQTQPVPATLPDGFLISDADYDSGVTAPANAAQPVVTQPVVAASKTQ